MFPNDDFGGFEPLRLQVRMTGVNMEKDAVREPPLLLTVTLSLPQKPGYYEPKMDGAQ